MNIRRWIFGLVLAAMIGGCIYVPELGPDRKSKLDAVEVHAANGSTLEVGRTSREEVMNTLGKPYRHTKRRLAIGYAFFRTYGYTVGVLGGPCGPNLGVGPDVKIEEPWLAFDEAGVLRKIHPYPVGDQSKWSDFISDVADEDEEPSVIDFPRYP